MNFGDAVPDIVAHTTQGEPFRLSERRGRYVVIYFFPKAFTPGCTAETKQFRDHYPELAALGAEVVGISTDDHEVQCDFSSKLKVPFPLIADPNAEIVKAYGVKWPLFNLAQRVTVIVDPNGKLAGFFHHELNISKHSNEVIAFLSRLKKDAAPQPRH
jgi:thioredoxin-dependent peroxiredoxin